MKLRQIHKIALSYVLAAWIALGVLTPCTVYGEDLEVPLIAAGTQDEMNRYELPDGRGFMTNLKQGDQGAMVAAFSFDQGLSYELYRNGVRISYVNEMLIQKEGAYEMKVISSYGGDRAYGLFTFSIVELDLGYLEQFQFGKVIESPDMEVKFDPKEGGFECMFPNLQSFQASVPNGGLAREEVRFTFPDNMTVVVRQEDRLTAPEEYRFWEPGSYMLTVTSMPDMQGRSTDYNTYVLRYYFRIIGEQVNDVDVVNAPQGFAISSVFRDGVPIRAPSREYHILNQDGEYRFVMTGTGLKVEYDVVFNRDTWAPLIHFHKEYDRFGNLKRVSYEGSETGKEVALSVNSEDAGSTRGTLTGSGAYMLRISDRAGNYREYRIVIPMAREFTRQDGVIVTFIILMAVTGFMIHARRHMRVL